MLLLPFDSESCCRTWNGCAYPFDEFERCQFSPNIVSAAARIFSSSGLMLDGIQEAPTPPGCIARCFGLVEPLRLCKNAAVPALAD